MTEPNITHDDLCYLSRLFNDNENVRSQCWLRINDWLKYQIERRKPDERTDLLNLINTVNAGVA